jgi:hypothetical protein
MTLSQRNRFLAFSITASSIALAAFAVLVFYAIGGATLMVQGAAFRAGGMVQPLFVRFFRPFPLAPVISMLLCLCYAIAGGGVIYHSFEKTNSQEIIFIVFFTLSFSFEGFRLLCLINQSFPMQAVYLDLSARFLYFGRLMGTFCLFASGVYAAGLNMKRHSTPLGLFFIAAMFLANTLPVDSGAWDSAGALANGYAAMLTSVEAGIMALSAVSYFIGGHVRSSREYARAGLGIFLVFLGRNTLLNADTIAALVLGALVLSAGSRLVLDQLHKAYLWL